MTQKVLLVDDDPNILSAYTRTLRKRYEFETALGGAEGLARIRAAGPFAVILSDMRMPGMDGIQFLMEARLLSPDSVRIMLTGNADQQTSIDAVNHGHIFRFLTKPCEPEILALSLEAAIDQYKLITAEKELVEGTLKGSIDLLMEMLAIADPTAFSKAQSLAPLAQKIAKIMEMDAPWVVMVAAQLSQIGVLTVPSSVMAKVRKGEPITAKEHETVTRLPEISSNLIERIPRMEQVAETIRFMSKNFNGSGFPNVQVRGEEIPKSARILRVASDYLDLLAKRPSPRAVMDEMREKHLFYDPRVLNALNLALDVPDTVVEGTPQAPHQATHETVEIGQVLVEGVMTREGVLLYPPNTLIGQSHLERLKNFASLVGLKEPFLVLG